MENKERMYHIGLTKSDIEGAKYAILPGDPGRVSKIARMLDSYKPIAVNREFTSYLGTIDNEKVLVISTGIGGPSTAICVEEIALLGIETVIRVGTSGGMQQDVNSGDLVIASSAIRQEGTTKEYVPVEFPAVADIDVLNALIESAKNLGYPYHTGVIQSKDSFYGQHSLEKMPVGYELKNKWNAWIKAGCLASDMETAAVYIVSQIRGIKAGSVLSVIWNQEQSGGTEDFSTERSIKTAVDAIRILIKRK
jgi:uridine phosphorylase